MKRKHFNRNKNAVGRTAGGTGEESGGRWPGRAVEAMVEIRNGKTARVNDGTRHRPPGTNIKS